jgi:NTP pyrophosphatase (non-canonical NTP hydrolase)
MKAFSVVEKDVVEWARERGILDFSSPTIQLAKTLEELGELLNALVTGDDVKALDGYGDTLVTLIISFHLWSKGDHPFGITESLESAFEEIKNRKGKMVGGMFVKEA